MKIYDSYDRNTFKKYQTIMVVFRRWSSPILWQHLDNMLTTATWLVIIQHCSNPLALRSHCEKFGFTSIEFCQNPVEVVSKFCRRPPTKTALMRHRGYHVLAIWFVQAGFIVSDGWFGTDIIQFARNGPRSEFTGLKLGGLGEPSKMRCFWFESIIINGE